MWIPTPLYERLPQFWFLLGLLFVSNGLYIGLDVPIAFAYAGIGFSSCAYGIGIAILRIRFRQDKSSASVSDDEPSTSEEMIPTP